MDKRQKSNKKNRKKLNPKLKNVLLLEVSVLLIYLIVATIVCLLLFTVDIPINSVYYIILVSMALSSFLSGYLVGKKIKKNGLISGVVYNSFIILTIALISLTMNDFSFDFRLFITFAVMLIMSAAGGVSAVNTKRKSR